MSNEQRIKVLEEKREKINNVSCSFCTAKWLQTTLLLQNGYNHSCHHPAPHKIPLKEIEADPAALHNSEYKKQQRAKMLNGERPKECGYCWKIEDLGNDYFSDRHYKTSDTWAWDRFEDIAKSNPQENVYPSYLEVSFSNACNFACAYCSPEISSKWMEEIKQSGPYPTSTNFNNLDNVLLQNKMPIPHKEYNPYVEAFWKWWPEVSKTLNILRITGGEPLMHKSTWELFERLDKDPKPHLQIEINSNMGVKPKLVEKLVSAVKKLKAEGKIKSFKLYTSIDTWTGRAEYTRTGLDIKLWERNLDYYLSNTGWPVTFMITFNLFSVTSFDTLLAKILAQQVDSIKTRHLQMVLLQTTQLQILHRSHQFLEISTARDCLITTDLTSLLNIK